MADGRWVAGCGGHATAQLQRALPTISQSDIRHQPIAHRPFAHSKFFNAAGVHPCMARVIAVM